MLRTSYTNPLSPTELQSLINDSKNAIALLNLSGEIQYTNKGFSNLTGYSIDEIYGKKPEILRGKDTSISAVTKIWERMENMQPVHDYLLQYGKDSIPYWVFLHVMPLFDKNNTPTHYIVFLEKTDHEPQAKEIDLKLASLVRDAFLKDGRADIDLQDRLFIIDLPKEGLGGSFYLFKELPNKTIGFVGNVGFSGTTAVQLTTLYSTYLKELIEKFKTLSPTLIINKLKDKISHVFKERAAEFINQLKASLVFIDHTQNKITYTSINQVIYLSGSNLDQKLKANKSEVADQSTNYTSPSMLYLSSNSLEHQKNAKGEIYSSQRFRFLIADVATQNLSNQKSQINESIKGWLENNTFQKDDIIIMGIKL